MVQQWKRTAELGEVANGGCDTRQCERVAGKRELLEAAADAPQRVDEARAARPARPVRCAAGQQKSLHVKGQVLLGICCAAEEHIR